MVEKFHNSAVYKSIHVFYKTMFFQSCDFIFNFFCFFSKMRQYIDPSGYFVFYEICCSSNFIDLHLDDVLEVLMGVELRFRKNHWKNLDDWLINGGDI